MCANTESSLNLYNNIIKQIYSTNVIVVWLKIFSQIFKKSLQYKSTKIYNYNYDWEHRRLSTGKIVFPRKESNIKETVLKSYTYQQNEINSVHYILWICIYEYNKKSKIMNLRRSIGRAWACAGCKGKVCNSASIRKKNNVTALLFWTLPSELKFTWFHVHDNQLVNLS